MSSRPRNYHAMCWIQSGGLPRSQSAFSQIRVLLKLVDKQIVHDGHLALLPVISQLHMSAQLLLPLDSDLKAYPICEICTFRCLKRCLHGGKGHRVKRNPAGIEIAEELIFTTKSGNHFFAIHSISLSYDSDGSKSRSKYDALGIQTSAHHYNLTGPIPECVSWTGIGIYGFVSCSAAAAAPAYHQTERQKRNPPESCA